MSIYELLEKDHLNVVEVALSLVCLDEKDSHGCGLALEHLRTEWVPSLRAEEAVFYNSLRRTKALSGWIAGAYQTHVVLESFLRILQIQHKMGAAWRETAATFRAGLEKHFQKEANELFPVARRFIRREEAEMLGHAFERIKKSSRGGSFTQSSLELAANLMPPRFASDLRSYNLETRL